MLTKPNYERQSIIIFPFWEWENVILRFPELRAIIPFTQIKDEVKELEDEINPMT